jgi:hypothetical protein
MDDYLNRYAAPPPETDEIPPEYYDDYSGGRPHGRYDYNGGPVEDMSPEGGGDIGDESDHDDVRSARPPRADSDYDGQDDFSPDDRR